jgi:hypothetical protein
MIQLKTKKSDVIDGYYEATLIVDTGTSVVSIDMGVVHSSDLVCLSYEMAGEAEKTLKRIGEIPEGF